MTILEDKHFIRFLAFALLLVVRTVDALGQNNFFIGAGTTDSWDDPANWSMGVVPLNAWVHPNAWDDHELYGFELTPGDTSDDGPVGNNRNMFQANGTTVLVDSSVYAKSFGVRVGNGGATNTLMITGGQLDIGVDADGLVGPGGGHHLQVGRGYPGFEGGPVNANPLATVRMTGGVMNTNGLLIPEQFVNNSLPDPTDSAPLNGELIMSGGTINARWMNLGQLKGNGSAELSGDAVINLESNVPGQPSNGGHLSFNRNWFLNGQPVPSSGDVNLDIRDNAIMNIYGHVSDSLPDPDASEVARYQGYIDAGEMTADDGTDVPTIYFDGSSVIKICALDADFDSDCDTDADDLATWEANYGMTGVAGDLKAIGDADNDGDVDGADFLELQREYGVGIDPVGSLTSTPEPTTAALFVVGGVLFAFDRRHEEPKNTTNYANSGTKL